MVMMFFDFWPYLPFYDRLNLSMTNLVCLNLFGLLALLLSVSLYCNIFFRIPS